MSKMRILRNIYIAVQPQFLYVVIITFVGAFTINYRVAASPVEIVLNTTNHGITINASPNWNPLPNAQYSNKTQNNNILTDLKISETIPSILAPQQTPMSINTLPTVYYGHKKRDRLLKCHCDICKETNFICETDGYCFTSVEKGSDATTFSYRCLQKVYDLQREPLECLTSRKKQNIYKIKCCDYDFCNKDELLKLNFTTDACL
ncbi:uncharacterized protein LOC119662942 isoform X3 [Teleopsis dalmanni]|uniref:uncharacterized protein LOC119662942 isoform X3 n=1 Tax=Teleopsis dalmanni TaxID=139649 RepID=UPI0018CE2BA6|nr:uncharacterized protein LOC119662942 isoform X3 [Teleopsis dalmanni]